MPSSLADAIDFVAVSTPVRRTRHEQPAEVTAKVATTPSDSDDPQACLFDRAVPPCIRTAYGVTGAANATSFNGQAVIVNQPFKPSDLAAFEREHKLPSQAVAHTVGHNTGDAGDEATLDVQFIIAMGQRVPTWWVYINGHTANPFASWLLWASNTSQIPYVHSLSVGEPEGDFERDNPGGVINRMNDEMAALGARGISILVRGAVSKWALSVHRYRAANASHSVSLVRAVRIG